MSTLRLSSLLVLVRLLSACGSVPAGGDSSGSDTDESSGSSQQSSSESSQESSGESSQESSDESSHGSSEGEEDTETGDESTETGDEGDDECIQGDPIDDAQADCPGDASCPCDDQSPCSVGLCIAGTCTQLCDPNSCPIVKDGVADLRLSVLPVNFALGDRYAVGTRLEVLHHVAVPFGDSTARDPWLVVRDACSGALELARLGNRTPSSGMLSAIEEDDESWLWPLQITDIDTFEPCMLLEYPKRQFVELIHAEGGAARLIDSQIGWAPGCYRVGVERLELHLNLDRFWLREYDMTIAHAGGDARCGEPSWTEECEPVSLAERDQVVAEWLDTVLIDEYTAAGLYTAKLDCVVLERSEDEGWLHHALDCDTLAWQTLGP